MLGKLSVEQRLSRARGVMGGFHAYYGHHGVLSKRRYQRLYGDIYVVQQQLFLHRLY